MKTINFLTVLITAVLLSISFSSSNSFSSQTEMDCKCCGQECIDAKCCTMDTGTSQGNSSCCTDKCTSEECKKCCESGNCKMMKKTDDASQGNEGTSNTMVMSCCSDKGSPEGKPKDCCK